MKTISIFFLPVILFLTCCNIKEDPEIQPVEVEHGIIPLPFSIEFYQEELIIGKNITLVNNTAFANAVVNLRDALNQSLNAEIALGDQPSGESNIQFVQDNSLAAEAYKIGVNKSGITISAKTDAGAFYASQTLRQFLRTVTANIKKESFEIPYLLISDAPKYAWRGFHLDLSRHFFTKEYIYELIDWLAYYKMNKLHLHLTDDQGWRLQIDQYPLLTSIGGWRTFNSMDSICIEKAKTNPIYQLDHRFVKTVDGKQVYGGFFTKQDIKDIIQYASVKCIDIIPEVDMPGHMTAAIRAYPFLSGSGTTGWGKEFSHPLCPCKPEAMTFVYKVLDEICELFPSQFIHIGCDEVDKSTWASAPECQSFLKDNNLTGVNQIQNYFVNQAQKYLEANGKKVLAWDDVMDGSVNSDLTIMYWRDWMNTIPRITASNGNDLIFTRWDLFYFSSRIVHENIREIYEYDLATDYSAEIVNKVIGFQACVWTEEIPSEQVFEQHAFPALQAFAELAWRPTKTWYSFTQRMKPHFKLMNSQQTNYHRVTWE